MLHGNAALLVINPFFLCTFSSPMRKRSTTVVSALVAFLLGLSAVESLTDSYECKFRVGMEWNGTSLSGLGILIVWCVFFVCLFVCLASSFCCVDANFDLSNQELKSLKNAVSALMALISDLHNTPPDWSGIDPCGDGWEGITCQNTRVISM